MSKNYDNWERLVGAVLLKEELRRIALCPSFSSSVGSSSSLDGSFVLRESLQLPASESSFVSMGFSCWDGFFPQEGFIDERTGKEIAVLGANELKISLGTDTSEYCKWARRFKYSLKDVVGLKSAWQLDVSGKIHATILAKRTLYAAFLVLKMTQDFEGHESALMMIRLRHRKLKKDDWKRTHIVHIQLGDHAERYAKVRRGDGWMEVEIGSFYTTSYDKGEVEARLLAIRKWKDGLVVAGIMFRPTFTYKKLWIL